MAITDINISEQLQTDAPSIKYTGNEGPQNPQQQQQQQEMQVAQQIWEALDPEQQGQFQSFEQFFQSVIWKQILQQMQADQGQGPETQPGIGSLGPQPMGQMPNRMGAEDGGRIGFRYGSPHSNNESTLMQKIKFLMEEFGLSKEEALERALPSFRRSETPSRPFEFSEEMITDMKSRVNPSDIKVPNIDPGFEIQRGEENIDPGFEVGIETLRGRR